MVDALTLFATSAHNGPADRGYARTDEGNGRKLGNAAASERIDEARRLREGNDEERRLSGRLGIHREEEREDGEVKGTSANAEKRPQGTRDKSDSGLGGTSLDVKTLNGRPSYRIDKHDGRKHDKHRGLSSTYQLGMGGIVPRLLKTSLPATPPTAEPGQAGA